MRFDQKEKYFTYKALVVALNREKLKTFYHFCGRLFPVWKIDGQISRLVQEFKTLYEPCYSIWFTRESKEISDILDYPAKSSTQIKNRLKYLYI